VNLLEARWQLRLVQPSPLVSARQLEQDPRGVQMIWPKGGSDDLASQLAVLPPSQNGSL